MADELVRQSNWVDVLVIIVLLWTVFMAAKKGFMIEAFKLTGTIFAIFVSLHYYSNISEFISSHSPLPTSFADLISLVSLIVAILVLFKFFRDGILTLLKIHPLEILDRWGSVALGLVRGVFVASLISLTLFLSTIGYLQESVWRSFSSRYLLELSPRTYAFIFENFFSKFSSDENMNWTVFKSIENTE